MFRQLIATKNVVLLREICRLFLNLQQNFQFHGIQSDHKQNIVFFSYYIIPTHTCVQIIFISKTIRLLHR